MKQSQKDKYMDGVFKINEDGNFVFDKELFGFYLKRGIRDVNSVVALMEIRAHIDDEINYVFLEKINSMINNDNNTA